MIRIKKGINYFLYEQNLMGILNRISEMRVIENAQSIQSLDFRVVSNFDFNYSNAFYSYFDR